MLCWNRPVEGALIALVGVLLGWLLGQGGELVKDRRNARDAARVVAAELVGTVGRIRHARTTPAGWRTLVEFPVSSTVWEAQKLPLTRIVEVGLILHLASDYETIALSNITARVMVELEQLRREGPSEDRDAARKGDEAAFEQAVGAAQAAAEHALREIGPIGDISGAGSSFCVAGDDGSAHFGSGTSQTSPSGRRGHLHRPTTSYPVRLSQSATVHRSSRRKRHQRDAEPNARGSQWTRTFGACYRRGLHDRVGRGSRLQQPLFR
jgi:hypothetical protein